MTVIDDDTFDYAALSDQLYEKYGIDHVAKEFRDGKMVTLHIIKIPSAGEGGYREILSLGAFEKNEQKRSIVWPNGKDGGCYSIGRTLPRWFHLERRTDHEWREFTWGRNVRAMGKTYAGEGADAVVVEHDSIWDFYQAIGYDYKKKKFL